MCPAEPRGHPETIVRPKAGRSAFEVERLAPRDELAAYVDYYWLVRWHTDAPYRQQVVPQPRIHLAAEDGRLLVHGVTREPFFRTLTGTGHVLGAAFLAGGFRPFLDRSVSGLAGTVLPAGEVLGIDDRATAAIVLGRTEGTQIVAALEEYLVSLGPEPDPVAAEVTGLVDLVERDRSITRAEALADRAGVSLRTLQRLFGEYVGIGPKWVIQRFRVLDAAAAAHGGDPVDWAALAGELGFSDQAHLTRLFTQVIGTPPSAYRLDPGTS